jgi:mannose-6-phosphate isomerase-like protein (cupin superfamily)
MDPRVTRTRLDPDAGERYVSIRRPLGIEGFGFNQMVLEPGQRGRIHRHLYQEEVYVVLEGTLTLAVEGRDTDLHTGTVVRVPAELRRQLINRGPERVVLLALGSAGEHVGRDAEAFASWESQEAVTPQELPLPEDLPASERRAE